MFFIRLVTVGELESRRLAFIEACAYYIRLKGINGDLDRLVMTMELAELITERYKMKQLFWAISGFKSYEQLLADGMAETGKRKFLVPFFTLKSFGILSFDWFFFNFSARFRG